ncbi:uncharacterized protein LOC129796887 isoform X2 [Lutzomyia longipalpis]|uniref:uncharacterized protein LOC129796887 isoform X2 n=1 Tax=Lutzomyia longipalpis TaxID=7200 RepID=UPI0024835830|nr:uncharacterized protein LOC129796887 isoform X2 [Lutzomyia longipalpis]
MKIFLIFVIFCSTFGAIFSKSVNQTQSGEGGEGSNKKPLEIPATPKCPTGYSLTDKACKKITVASPAIQKGDTSHHYQLPQPYVPPLHDEFIPIQYECPPGYTLRGTTCYVNQLPAIPRSNPWPSPYSCVNAMYGLPCPTVRCPPGYQLSYDGWCWPMQPMYPNYGRYY